eukprot:15733452-Heterocapsa_arctica.AAC.1
MAFEGTWLKPDKRCRAVDTSSGADGVRCVRGKTRPRPKGRGPARWPPLVHAQLRSARPPGRARSPP